MVKNFNDSMIEGAAAGSRDGIKLESQQVVGGRKASHKTNPSRKPSSNESGNPLDINNANFDPELFVNRLISEASLSQLMAQEGEIVRSGNQGFFFHSNKGKTSISMTRHKLNKN